MGICSKNYLPKTIEAQSEALKLQELRNNFESLCNSEIGNLKSPAIQDLLDLNNPELQALLKKWSDAIPQFSQDIAKLETIKKELKEIAEKD